MADKKRDILEFFEQMNFEQMIPTQGWWWSTARNSFARKPVFQANLQIRSLVFDIYQKKKKFSKEIEIEIFQLG